LSDPFYCGLDGNDVAFRKKTAEQRAIDDIEAITAPYQPGTPRAGVSPFHPAQESAEAAWLARRGFIAQNVERKLWNFLGHKFWARGYFVSTVGRTRR
jgi:hypothetical protein